MGRIGAVSGSKQSAYAPVPAIGGLDSTLVMFVSDMQNGDLHATEHLPVLLCCCGADLRFGQTVSDRATRRPLSDL